MNPGLIFAVFLSMNPADKAGKIKERAIVEPSGIVASRAHPGIFWVHNDSGNPPALFAVRADGTLVRSYLIEAPNVDWEDIAIDDAGHLYLGDIGDNLHVLPIHSILRIDEPDPEVASNPALKLKAKLFSFVYPKRDRHDAEGIFIDGDQAIVVTKRGDGEQAEMFGITLDKPGNLLKPSMAKSLGVLKGSKRPATGADLSANGRLLAICSLGEIRIYRRDADGTFWNLRKMKSPPGQVEGICWDDSDLVLVNEDREIFRISKKVWEAETREKGKSK